MGLRIDETRQPNTQCLPATAKEHATGGFSQALAQAEKLQRQELVHFLARLDTQGRKLAESLSLADLQDFRQLVKSFLRSTLGQSRSLTEETVWDFRGRPKIMARVARIDQALEELGRQVLKDHAAPLDILAKIDEIRGLIVDLTA